VSIDADREGLPDDLTEPPLLDLLAALGDVRLLVIDEVSRLRRRARMTP
jgi:hypothetical protein